MKEERKLAKIVKIDDVIPHPNADQLDIVVWGGWNVIVRKNEFKAGDLCVACEIDSWVPNSLAPFLSKGQPPREYNGVKGERLRTIKLRGQISQGLVLPLSALPYKESHWYDDPEDGLLKEMTYVPYEAGDDVTEILSIQKYEAPIPACLSGVMKGNFPSHTPKTDELRIQSFTNEEIEELLTYTYIVTEKIDGSSFTSFSYNGNFGVCSRNLELIETEGNTLWAVANKYNLKNALPVLGNISISGEIVGPGIQKNPYNLKEHDVYVFYAWNIDTQEYLSESKLNEILTNLGMKRVPIIHDSLEISSFTINDIITMADGKSALNPNTNREGLVFKTDNRSKSWKIISNQFLLKEKD